MSYKIIKDGKEYNASQWCKKLNERHYKTPYKGTYGILRKHAKRRSIELSMTYEEFLPFTEELQCHYCLSDIVWIKHGKVNAYNLDRIDNEKGYSKENCVVCCWKCNNSKGNRYSHEEWYGMTEYFRRNK
jgi:5-methylcytosine-specific restriction endonuclease McrA